jgi:O-methyltransferase
MSLEYAKSLLKWIGYRLPGINKIGAPSYPYKITPGQLAHIVNSIDATKGNGGCIVERGVARGMTSLFIAQHLKDSGDDRILYLLDTFSGFDAPSIEFEVNQRGKDAREFSAFRYGDQGIFEHQIGASDFPNIRIIKADASTFDYTSIGPIDVALLDIDLYKATKSAAKGITPLLSPNGSLLIDDCMANTPWDGSLQAYKEICQELNLKEQYTGSKGGVVSFGNRHE